MTIPKVSDCYRRKLGSKIRKFNHPRPLNPYLVPLMPDSDYVFILDVGAGPLTTLGAELSSVFIYIVACDILAEEYIGMMEKRGVLPYNLVEQENMEALNYSDGFFDIVHCRNALDHTENPEEALREMLRVCKSGGWIYLMHYPNVGENNKYRGSHYWNLSILEGDCRIWNREEAFLLTEVLGLPDAVTYLDEGMIISKGQKE